MSDTASRARFAAAWTAAGGTAEQALPVADALLAAWREPQRHYHTLQHLHECLGLLDAVGPAAAQPHLVELALWFHDAVYAPQRSDNEARSAEWAAAAMAAGGIDGAARGRVCAMVLATRDHAADGDADTLLLLDIDLAILGAPPARFAEYARQIRAEYAHVADADYRAGRARVLRGFLQRERLYATPQLHARLDAGARANLAHALQALGAADDPSR